MTRLLWKVSELRRGKETAAWEMHKAAWGIPTHQALLCYSN